MRKLASSEAKERLRLDLSARIDHQNNLRPNKTFNNSSTYTELLL